MDAELERHLLYGYTFDRGELLDHGICFFGAADKLDQNNSLWGADTIVDVVQSDSSANGTSVFAKNLLNIDGLFGEVPDSNPENDLFSWHCYTFFHKRVFHWRGRNRVRINLPFVYDYTLFSAMSQPQCKWAGGSRRSTGDRL